jgi:hypothetical protein
VLFAIAHLKFPVRKASMMLSAISGVKVVGKLLGIPPVAVLRPITHIAVDLLVIAISSGLQLTFVNCWPDVIWRTFALIGLSISTTFAGGLAWIAPTYHITGRSSLIVGLYRIFCRKHLRACTCRLAFETF